MQSSNNNYFIYVWGLILTFCLVFSYSCKPKTTPPKAVKGVLDLRDWDLEPETSSGMDGIIKLDGEWEFYPFILPDPNGELPEERKHYMEVPKLWNHFVYRDENGDPKEISGVGYGTFRLRILANAKSVEIKTPYQGTAFSLDCNKERKFQSGIVGITQESTLPSRKIPPHKSCETIDGVLQLTLSISNFHIVKGGYRHSIFLGSSREILEKREMGLSLDLFVAGILFIMGTYHLSLYSLRREDRSALYFGILCILLSLRSLLFGENYLYNLIPNIHYDIYLKMDYLTVYLSTPIFIKFIGSLYPEEINNFIQKSIIGICSILSLFVILLPPLYFTRTLATLEFTLIVSILYVLWILIHTLKNRRFGARAFSFGFIFFSITIINDLLYNINLINTGFFLPLGLVVFIFSQSYMLSSRFALAFIQVKDLSLNLEKKVEDRTRALEEQKSEIEQAYSDLQFTQEALSRAERSASINSMVSHLAHEVNNPLNYISTGEMITKESVQEAKSFILGAIPDSPESKPFVDKIKALFEEIDLGIQQSAKGTVRIRDTIQEIRAITGVDGIHVDNFDLLPLLYSNWELTCEKNQVPNGLVALVVNGMSWPDRFLEPMVILSQKYIFSRAIRTLLNNCIHFARKNPNPKIQIEMSSFESNDGQVVSISIRNNGPAIEQGAEKQLFDLKSSKYFGTELIGLPFVKEILKSVQCNLGLTDNGRTSGWVELEVLMKEYR